MTIRDVSVWNSCQVGASVCDMPPLYTQSGVRPIDPVSIVIRYSAKKNRDPFIVVEVKGRALFSEHKTDGLITRIFLDIKSVPEWVRVFVNEHQPQWELDQ